MSSRPGFFDVGVSTTSIVRCPRWMVPLSRRARVGAVDHEARDPCLAGRDVERGRGARQWHRLVAAEQGAHDLAALQAHLRVEHAGDGALGDAQRRTAGGAGEQVVERATLRCQRGATLERARRCDGSRPAPAAATRGAGRARRSALPRSATGWRRSARTLPVAWPPATPTSSEPTRAGRRAASPSARDSARRGSAPRAGAWRRSSAPRPRHAPSAASALLRPLAPERRWPRPVPAGPPTRRGSAPARRAPPAMPGRRHRPTRCAGRRAAGASAPRATTRPALRGRWRRPWPAHR